MDVPAHRGPPSRASQVKTPPGSFDFRYKRSGAAQGLQIPKNERDRAKQNSADAENEDEDVFHERGIALLLPHRGGGL